MKLTIPDKVYESYRNMRDAILDKTSSSFLIHRLAKQFCKDVVDFISEDYFGVPCNKEFKFKFIDKPYSCLNAKHDTISIGYPSGVARTLLAPSIAFDIVHESVHFCQDNFFQNYNRQMDPSYITALFHDIMATDVHIEHDGYESRRTATPYQRASTSGFQADMYRAQPAEMQANMVAIAFFKGIIDREPEKDFYLEKRIARAERTCSFDHLSHDFAQWHQYNLTSMISKSILNACCGTNYKIEKNVAQFFDDNLMKQLSRSDRKHLEGFSIAAEYAEAYYVIDSQKAIYEVQDVADPHKLEELLLSDIKIMPGEDSGIKMVVDGQEHPISSKDIEEFLFCIGNKKFKDISREEKEPVEHERN